MPDVLLDVARQLGGEMTEKIPWNNFEEMLREQYGRLRNEKGSISAANPHEFWTKLQQDGVWSGPEGVPPVSRALATFPLSPKTSRRLQGFWWRTALSTSLKQLMVAPPPAEMEEPRFDGAESEFAFYFLPYESQACGDGSLAHLPWLQEMPDPLSTAMWSSWVEINTQTAERLGIKQGDLLEVASQHGKLQAPALVTPGIAPDVVAMPVGQGHTNFTRYASGRGANPISILAPMVVPETGSLAWAATRVKISKIGEGKLALFGAELREHPHEHR
jgi:anaerobic selenocysteine-containing dehydrogenase